jgi:hypothetical protein
LLIKEKLNVHFKRLKVDQEKRIVPQTMHIYKIDRNELPFEPTLSDSDDSLPPSDPIVPVFSPEDSYWMKGLRKVRFNDCKRRGILYRPEIVKDMMKAVEDAFNIGGPAGIMIKGPQGIGKSHSLVNLIRTLQYDSSCKYLVTVIPDCQHWNDIDHLYTAICSSFGTSLSALSWSSSPGSVSQEEHLKTFVNAIDLILRRMKKKWVLVFDQINRLFTRFASVDVKDLRSLPFPFKIINDIMQGDHIVSIVSASANNEIAYKERHQGFEEYNHPCKMDLGEICAAFEVVATQNDHERILEVTGGVPWQVKKLISFNFSVDDYEEAELCIILASLDNLKETKSKTKFDCFTTSAIACVLSTTGDPIEYDRIYSIPRKGTEAYQYEPLFPVVIVAYRHYFLIELLAFVKTHEELLLKVVTNHG